MWDGIKAEQMLILYHVRLKNSEQVNKEAWHAYFKGFIFERPQSFCDSQSLRRPILLRKWQERRDFVDTGWFDHSISPFYLEISRALSCLININDLPCVSA
jgi:hypothetical protein